MVLSRQQHERKTTCSGERPREKDLAKDVHSAPPAQAGSSGYGTVGPLVASPGVQRQYTACCEGGSSLTQTSKAPVGDRSALKGDVFEKLHSHFTGGSWSVGILFHKHKVGMVAVQGIHCTMGQVLWSNKVNVTHSPSSPFWKIIQVWVEEENDYWLNHSRSDCSLFRNLFGPVDHDQLRQDLQLKLKEMMSQDSQRWNFNFQSETPQLGRFQWEEILAGRAASFYQESPQPVVEVNSPRTEDGGNYFAKRRRSTEAKSIPAITVNAMSCTHHAQILCYKDMWLCSSVLSQYKGQNPIAHFSRVLPIVVVTRGRWSLRLFHHMVSCVKECLGTPWMASGRKVTICCLKSLIEYTDWDNHLMADYARRTIKRKY
ncbi:hypothetical protein CCH79_00006271 [Gambusia affinis]|uniref:Cyclin-dependent kinase inhibitor domain-containing protein n=1 Tax=Gambusia affinis TaxID=33528 RepID=A0A315W1Q2_GAMAF|nr:hypothetical protein CCH79_00006271 [Gambusia affinis]